jgi:hypothetical protein
VTGAEAANKLGGAHVTNTATGNTCNIRMPDGTEIKWIETVPKPHHQYLHSSLNRLAMKLPHESYIIHAPGGEPRGWYCIEDGEIKDHFDDGNRQWAAPLGIAHPMSTFPYKGL